MSLGIILTVGALLLSPGFLIKNVAKGQSSCHTEIHIGEVVDETEEYGYALLKEYTDLYDNAVLAKDAGLSAANNAASMIDSIAKRVLAPGEGSEYNDADTLIGLTDDVYNCRDCDGHPPLSASPCVTGSCNCPRFWKLSVSEFDIGLYEYCEPTGGCLTLGPWPPCPCPPHCIVCPPCPCIEHEYKCYFCKEDCSCTSCARPDGTQNPCPMLQINNTVASLTNYYNSANTNYGNIDTVWSNIKNIYNPKISTANTNIVNLTVISPVPTQISAKLDIARKELTSCLTPFGCVEQILMGNKTCIIGGKTFDLEYLYTCPLLSHVLEESNPRCDAEAVDINKANNFFCCDTL